MRIPSAIGAAGKLLRERGPALVCLAALSGYVAAVSIWKPGSAALLACPFHALTGLYCPGCGMTRMLYQLVHGHLALAFAQNELAFIALPYVLWRIVLALLPLRWQNAQKFAVSPRWAYAIVTLIVIFTLLRNLPYWPACTLAPGGC